MRKSLFVLLMLLLVAMAVPAAADVSCAAGNICYVSLTQSNVTQLAGVVVTVKIDNQTNSSHTILSFWLSLNPLTNAPGGIDKVGWNSGSFSGPTNPWSVISSSANWGAANPAAANQQMDGFGRFSVYGASPAGTGGTSSSNKLTFTLAGVVTSFPVNANGNVFAIHMRFNNSCSGFIGGLVGTTSVDSNPGCSPAPPPKVPEPGTMALFGTGLIGIAGILKRRLRG